jgi:voltage-gated sodium channel
VSARATVRGHRAQRGRDGARDVPAIRSSFPAAFDAFFLASQAFFVAEIAIRIGSFGRRPQDFFRDPWNAFDFAVVAVSMVPAVGAAGDRGAGRARSARVARRFGERELRTIVATMLRSIPSMAHVVLLLGIVLFVYGMVGHHLFGATDPDHWGTIWRAAQTLFVVITLEGWVEIMAAAGAGVWSWLHFASFIVVAVFVAGPRASSERRAVSASTEL